MRPSADAAALHRRRLGAHRRQHAALAQQFAGMVLVFHVQVEADLVPLAQHRQRRHEPGGQQVGIDGDGGGLRLARRAPPVMPKGASACASSSCSCCAWRCSDSRPRYHAGLARRISTRPRRSSSALMRWLTAEGVTCSERAAASKLPSRSTAAKAASWRESSCISLANRSSESLAGSHAAGHGSIAADEYGLLAGLRHLGRPDHRHRRAERLRAAPGGQRARTCCRWCWVRALRRAADLAGRRRAGALGAGAARAAGDHTLGRRFDARLGCWRRDALSPPRWPMGAGGGRSARRAGRLASPSPT